MNKEDSARGLLSKVVRFVRNPTVQWSELDAPEEDKEGLYSKQMLKEMIERKRRNDFVRRREFDQLRKIRRKEFVRGQKLDDSSARTTFLQSTMMQQAANTVSPDGRAVTLKKIDEIEAQMSQQWWRAKPGALGGNSPVVPRVVPPVHDEARGTAEVPLEFAPTEPLADSTSFAPTTTAAVENTAAATIPMGPGAALMEFDVPTLGMDAVVAYEELEKFVHEPDLEEAALRFANGDHAGAESGLMEVLAQHADDQAEEQADIWMTLFDLYRATGQQDRFDRLAIEYAGRFGRSAPLWFSLPEQLGLEAAPAAGAVSAIQREFNWSAPALLTQQSLTALLASLARKPAPPWTLNWSRMAGIEPVAIPGLVELFLRWADEPVALKFVGVSALNELLRSKTPQGDRSVDSQWWNLRMAALRLMGLPDEFELVALDYCVTYEVSPPSWAPTLCTFTGDDSAANTAHEQAGRGPQPDRSSSEPRSSGQEKARLPGLSGYIDGDAIPLLEPFEALAQPDAPLIIACDHLIRMDFPAAGSVLNWAAEQQAKGRVVQFNNLHRLIAVFFNVIGVSEHAWVVPRRN